MTSSIIWGVEKIKNILENSLPYTLGLIHTIFLEDTIFYPILGKKHNDCSR